METLKSLIFRAWFEHLIQNIPHMFCIEFTCQVKMPYGLPRGCLNLAKFGIGASAVKGGQGLFYTY